MARSPLTTVLLREEPDAMPLPEAADVMLGSDVPPPSIEDGALKTELDDGGVIVDFNPAAAKNAKTRSTDFDANLAVDMEESELNLIAADLIQGIGLDDQSRQEWLSTHAEGIKLLGLVIEDAKTDAGMSSAPLDGMSTARHPLLLEAVLLFQANARGELLPAAGPVKVRDDRPAKPKTPPAMLGHNGGPPLDDAAPSPFGMPPGAPAGPPGLAHPMGAPPPMAGRPAPLGGAPVPPAPMPPPAPPQPSTVPGLPMPGPNDGSEDERDGLADALEKDFNHYLTTTAQEYYPDTDRMLFTVGFGGQGVKKVYNCPLRRRPVAESIAMEDFIVSNALTDLGNAARITHKIKLRPSTLKRMQLLNVYRDVPVGEPTGSEQPNAVDQAKAAVVGVQPQPQDPKDAEFVVYECYCELLLNDYAPPQFKGKGLALPYRVTMEKDSQKVLEIRRNWVETDAQCMAKEFFVEYPYVKAFGFYGIGLLHILGNTTKTLTAAWRECIDSGMFANFPGFLYSKGLGRQLSNQQRVAPGTGVGLDVGLANIRDAVMPLPYKDLGPAFTAFIEHVEQLGQRLGGTANMNIGEGRADAPVGTTLALIEQATKPIGAVLKRLFTGQSKELQLLKARFRDDPEAFWRFNKRPTMPWQKEQFVKALEDFDLVPVSDPNNPTKLHRAAKSAAITQYAAANPGVLNPAKVWTDAVAPSIELANPERFLAPPMPPQGPPAPPPDPAKLASAQAKMEGDKLKASTELTKAQMSAAEGAEERASRERVLEMKIELEEVRAEGRREAEQLRIAGQMAVAAERSEQVSTHKALDIVADNHHREADREHATGLHKDKLASNERVARTRAKPKPKGKT